MSNLEMYAEQCAKERLSRQLTEDILSFSEFEYVEAEDIEEVLKIVRL